MNAPLPNHVAAQVNGHARRASNHIARLLVAAPVVWLAGCAPEPVTQQDSYASMQDCMADWGAPEQCTAERSASPGGGPGYVHYWGPRYLPAERRALTRQDEGASRKLASRSGAPGAKGAGSVSRGGFGTTGRSHSTSGG